MRAFSDAELEHLFVQARALNLETGTTGVLPYDDGSFMQCFAALDADAELTCARIRASRRHTGLIELLDEPVAARGFADWRLGVARAARSELLALSSASRRRQVDDLGGAQGSFELQLLNQFWKRIR